MDKDSSNKRLCHFRLVPYHTSDSCRFFLSAARAIMEGVNMSSLPLSSFETVELGTL